MAKVAVGGSGLKPYWGKPAVRNFREGRGNIDETSASTQTLKGHWDIQLRHRAMRLCSTRRFNFSCPEKHGDPGGLGEADKKTPRRG
jgi:hypothetical protein